MCRKGAFANPTVEDETALVSSHTPIAVDLCLFPSAQLYLQTP
jgi:hypothetical protein